MRMRRSWVRIPSRPPSFKKTDLERAKQSYRGTLGLSSLQDSFRYLVIHPELHRLIPPQKPDGFRLADLHPESQGAVSEYSLIAIRQDVCAIPNPRSS